MSDLGYPECITGGIPPDEDHKMLFKCAVEGCKVTQKDQPLIVAAANGKMVTLCRNDYDLLTGKG